jgi:hypothetical protein
MNTPSRATSAPRSAAELDAALARIWKQLRELHAQEVPLIMARLRLYVLAAAPDAITAEFVTNDFENGYFLAGRPYLTLADGRELTWEDATDDGEEIDEGFMSSASDALGPVGDGTSLTLDLRTGAWSRWH